MDTTALASALRAIGKGFLDAAEAVDDSRGDSKRDREIAAMTEFDVPPHRGLDRAQASDALKRHGIDPRAFGSWVRHGWVVRDDDKRYLSAKGRQWLGDHAAG